MSSWLASALHVFAYFAGAYRTLKRLKDGRPDFEVLVFWVSLALVDLYSSYVEFLVSWFPFYSLLKSAFLVAMLVPRLRLSRLMFHTTVIPFMNFCHQQLEEHDLIELVLWELPSRALLLLFPHDAAEAKPEPAMPTKQVAPPRERARKTMTSRALHRLNEAHRLSEGDPSSPNPDGSPFRAPTSTPPREPVRRDSSWLSVRKVLTGDENVKIRDHLFDLSVPAPPRRDLEGDFGATPEFSAVDALQLNSDYEAKEPAAADFKSSAEAKVANTGRVRRRLSNPDAKGDGVPSPALKKATSKAKDSPAGGAGSPAGASGGGRRASRSYRGDMASPVKDSGAPPPPAAKRTSRRGTTMRMPGLGRSSSAAALRRRASQLRADPSTAGAAATAADGKPAGRRKYPPVPVTLRNRGAHDLLPPPPPEERKPTGAKGSGDSKSRWR